MTTRLAAASLVLACAAVSLGQNARVRIMPGGVNGVPNDAADVDAQAVYVRDSGVAGERLQLAERLEKQKEWAKAADVYQEMAQKYADRVVPVRQDKAGRPVQYVSATQTAQDRLAKWPAEGIAAYRKRFEDTARDALNADTTDRNAERTAARVMTLYFLTDAGRDAAMSVMSTAFERGDFVTVAGIGRRLLDTHPGLATERPKVLLWTGLAEHLAGRGTDAKARLDELQNKFADAVVPVGGADAKAVDQLTAALAVPAAPPGRYRSDDWPTPYGTPDAAAIPDQICVGGARLFSIPLPGPTRRSGNPQGTPQYRNMQIADRKSGASIGILPAVDSGALYFQDNARVWAVGLANGLPLPGWASTYPGDRFGCYAIDADPTPKNRQTAVTVAGDNVVALLSQYDSAASNVGASSQPPQLVCLDKLTGRRNWAVTANALKVPDAQGNLREGIFYGTPVADDSAVYVPLYANRGGQFEECYLVALNLSDGAFRWASYVASTSLGNRQLDFGGGITDSSTLTVATLSLAGGRLYVATNLGAVGCLDTADGRTLWLNVYEKSKQPFNGFIAPSRQSSKPFAFGPPIVADGRVFVLPTDCPSILIYDADDGSPVRTIPRAVPNSPDNNLSTLAGIVDGSLVVANRSTVFRLPWRTYDASKPVVESGGVAKTIPPAEDDKSTPDSIRGRVFVSGKYVLVPSAERLYRLSTATLQIESTYPATGKWDEEESAGNIVATPDNLIVAGPTRVTAYADLNVATAKLDAKLAASPNDVDAYLRYAELLLAAGQPKPAMEKLDVAAAKLGGRGSLTPGAQRDRLFEIAVGFAGKMQRVEPTSAVVFQLYDRAAATAATAEQQARYRLGRAAALRPLGRVEEELALQQQVLADPALRGVVVAGRTGPSTAGAEATLGVNELLRLRGVAIYKDFDRTAFEKLTELKQSPTPDADALCELADAYPAATSAPEALALAADRMEVNGDARRASQTLRRLLSRDLSNDRRQSVLQALARNALRLPGQAAIAEARLRQATAIEPDAKAERPLLLPDGTPLKADTLAAAVGAIDAYQVSAAQANLPSLGVPLTTGDVSEFKPAFKPVELVVPATAIVTQQADVARPNQVVIVNPAGKLGVVDARTAAVAWTDAKPTRPPIGCGYVGDLLVVVNADEVSGVDSAGKVRWTSRLAGLGAIDVSPMPGVEDHAADTETIENPLRQMNQRRVAVRRGGRMMRFPALPPRPVVDDAPPPPNEEFARFRLLSDRVVLTSSSGRTVAIDTNGKMLWQARVSEAAAGRLVSNDDFVAVSHPDPAGTTAQVCAFDAQNGQIVLRKAYDAGQLPAGPLVNLALSPDGVLVTMLAGRLIAQDLYDPGSGERKYERPNNIAGEGPFAQSNVDGQLVVAGDRVLAVVRGSDSRQAVHAFDLRTMRPLTTKDPTGQEPAISFTPGGGDSDTALPVTLRTAGKAFYVIGQRSFASYSVGKTEQAWTASNGAGDLGAIRDVIVAKDFVVLVRHVAAGGTSSPKLPAINVSMFNRAWLDDLDRENGSLEQRPTVTDAAAIEAGEWQVADNAFYYVSGDGKLKVLRANR